MLKLIRALGFLAFFASIPAQAQFRTCGTPPATPEQVQIVVRDQEALSQSRIEATNTAASVPIPVQIWVVRTNAGVGLTVQDALTAFTAACEYHRVNGVSFYLTGPIRFLDSTARQTVNDNAGENALCNGRDNPNAVNIYMGLTTLLNGAACGYAYINYPGFSQNTRLLLACPSSMAHELGHTFGLYHPHQNNLSSNLALRERVPRTNCSTAGDLLCDTPADPYGMSGATAANCVYTGRTKDADSVAYVNPSLTNSMSYWNCGETFTPQQGARMRYVRNSSLVITTPYPSRPGVTLAVSAPAGSYPQISWTTTDAASVGYQIEAKQPGDTAFTILGGAQRTAGVYSDSKAQGNTTYTYRLRNLENPDILSNEVTVTTGILYCTPDLNGFTNNCYSPVLGIRRVAVSSGTTAVFARQTDSCMTFSYYTGSGSAALAAGQAYTLATTLISSGTGSYYPQYIAAYIDYNQDGVFASSERIFLSTTTGSTQSAAFTLPATALAGQTRMRVRSQYSGNSNVQPCILNSYGETEDYLITIVIPCAKPAARFTVTGNVARAYPRGAGLTYQWYQNGNALYQATDSIYRDFYQGTVNLQVRVTKTISGGCDSLSPAQAVSYCDKPAVSFTANGNVLSLDAGLASINFTYQWYLDGAVVGGATSTSYTIEASGSYQIRVHSNYGNGCDSLSLPQTVTYTAPCIKPAALASQSGTNRLVAYPRTAGLTYQWYVAGTAIGGSTDTVLVISASGSYQVQVHTSTGIGCDSLSPAINATYTPPCVKPAATFTALGNRLYAYPRTAGFTYQWLVGGSAIGGATDTVLTITTTGSYQVRVATSANGSCDSLSAAINATYIPPAAPLAWQWARRGASTGMDRVNRVRVTPSGHIYSAGMFSGTLTLDGSLTTGSSQTLTCAGGTDGMLLRYRPNGSLEWAAQFSGAGADEALGLATDRFNYAYVSGYFTGSMTIHPQYGRDTTLVSAGGTDMFICKIHPNGNLVYAFRMGASGNDRAEGIDVAPDLRFYVAGSFIGQTAIGGKFGTVIPFTSRGNYDAFLAKFSDLGSLYWAIQGGGTGNDFGYGAAADITGGGFLMGSYEGTATFNSSLGGTTPISKTVVGGSDGFVLDVSITGQLKWVASMGGTTNENVRDVAPDPRGTGVVAVGGFSSSATFGPSALTARGFYDAFATRLDTSGSFVWTQKAGGFGQDQAWGVRLDRQGNPIVAMSFAQSAYSFGSNAATLTAIGNNNSTDALVVKLAAATGLPTWQAQAGGTGDDQARGVDTSSTATGAGAYAGGIYGPAFTLSPAAPAGGLGPYADAGLGDAWVARYANGTGARLGEEENVAATLPKLMLYPNPSNGSVTLRIQEADETAQALSIYGSDGKVVYSQPMTSDALLQGVSLRLTLPQGLYTVRAGRSLGRLVIE